MRWQISIIDRVIRLYQLAMSPYLGNRCRFIPSCSDYMREAVQEWGACKGIYRGLLRLLRCHPFGKGGFDPIRSDQSVEIPTQV